MLLRLAVLLNRSRSGSLPKGVKAIAEEETIALVFPSGWLDAHPLTRADLLAERKYIRAIDLEIEVHSDDQQAL